MPSGMLQEAGVKAGQAVKVSLRLCTRGICPEMHGPDVVATVIAAGGFCGVDSHAIACCSLDLFWTGCDVSHRSTQHNGY